MEEEKAAAYYDELTRRGEGAARFKQGLGFSAGNSDSGDNPPARGSALPYSSSSSSFLSKFVKASSPKTEPEAQKQAQIESIQNKLKKKKADRAEEEEEKQPPRVSEKDRRSRRRSRSRSRSRDRRSRRRSRSRERDRDRDRDRDRGRRRRSRSRSRSPRDRRRDRRSRSRSRSPRDRRRDRRSRSSSPRRKELEKSKGVDYSKLIQGYDKMSEFERVKAKMNHQLAETAEKDTTKGMGSGWERFEFDKDAPLDDEEIEVAEVDAALVKHIGQTFRFSSFETKREENITAAHDEAIFGRSKHPLTVVTDSDVDTDNPPTVVTDSDIDTENDVKDSKESEPTSLLSDKVLAKKQGSWRDRIREKKT